MQAASTIVTPPRLFAVVPAAGLSRRMGRSKLLLPLGGRSVIRRVVEALDAAGVTATFVLARRDDQALRLELAATSARIVATPQATADMRESVARLLDAVRAECAPRDSDGWLLCPADHPLLSPAVLTPLRDAWRQSPTGIIVPVYAGRRGHPTVFAWGYAERVGEIPVGQGLNRLLQDFASAVREVPVNDADVLVDLDVPADYDRLKARFEGFEG